MALTQQQKDEIIKKAKDKYLGGGRKQQIINEAKAKYLNVPAQQSSKDFTPISEFPQQQEPNKGVGRKVFDVFTESTQKTGGDLGTALSTILPDWMGGVGKMREETIKTTNQTVQNYINAANKTNDPAKKKKYFNMASEAAKDISGLDIYNNPEYQKTAGQIIGDFSGMGVETLTGGSAGGAVKSIFKTGAKQALKTGAKEIAQQEAKAITKGQFWKGVGQGIKGGATAGAAYGTTGALQEGITNPWEITKKAGKSAASGAIFGGMVGGIGAGVSKIAQATKKAISPTVKNLITSAVKPGKNNQQFDKDLDIVLNELRDDAPNIKDLRSLESAISAKKAQLYDQANDMLNKGSEQGLTLDGNSIAAEIRKLKNNPKLQREGQAEIQKLEKKARAYEGKIPVKEAAQIVEQTNAELNNYYRMNMTNRASVLKSDPSKAADIVLAENLRSQIDNILEKAENAGYKGLKKRHGALINVGKEVSGRIPVAERANMTSLAEDIAYPMAAGQALTQAMGGNVLGAAGSIGQVAVAKALKAFETSDSKVARAFSKLKIPQSIFGKSSAKAKETIKKTAENVNKKLPLKSTIDEVVNRSRNAAISIFNKGKK